MNYFIVNLVYILQLILNLYLYVLLLRVVLEKLRVNYHNPVIQILSKVTTPVVKPLRKILPYVKGYDLALLAVTVSLQALDIYFTSVLTPVEMPTTGFVLVLLGELGSKVVYIYIFAIILQAISSWLPHLAMNPALSLINLLCSPLMRLAHRVVPPLSGIDFSPILILFSLYVVNMLIFHPLIYYGFALG